VVDNLTLTWPPSWKAVAKKFAEHAEEVKVKAFIVKVDVDDNV
jgi:hypothetical protein